MRENMTYQPTPKQEEALREWLQEAIVPLIEQVLVKKLGQAMTFAAQEIIQPKDNLNKTWVGLTEDEAFACKGRDYFETYKAIEAKLKEKNFD